MARAAKPGGQLVILDYNHTLNRWEPAPPPAFAAFYDRFLLWRRRNGWDNEVANRCAMFFETAGLTNIRVYDEDVTAERGTDAFAEHAAIWIDVIDRLGSSMIAASMCDSALLEHARMSYHDWCSTALMAHTLSMKTTVATTRQSLPT